MTLRQFLYEYTPLGRSLSDLPPDAIIYSETTGEPEEIIDELIPKDF